MDPDRKIDWSLLRGPIIILVSSIILASSIMGSTWYYEEEMLAKYNADRKRFQNISNQYLAVDNEEKLIKLYFPEFINLYNRGFIGSERRLNWIETLRGTSEQLKLLSLRYEIDSQAPFTPDFPVNAGIFRLYSSPMKLSLDLLHIGDLQRLFEELDQVAQGFYNISTCRITRKGDPVSVLEIKPNMSAECELRWINIKRSDGSAINL